MSDNTLPAPKIDDEEVDRKIDWPVVTTRVSPETFARLEEAAEKADKKRGPFVRELIERAVAGAA